MTTPLDKATRSLDEPDERLMLELLKRLYPLHRTLVSPEMDQAMDLIGQYLPEPQRYRLHRYPSGQKVWTWTVPPEYVVHEAYLEVLEGGRPRKLLDFKDNPLHLVSYSEPIDRVLAAAEASGADHVVALTGDNPLVDPELIDDVLTYYQTGRFDYVTTTHMHHSRNWTAERTFPVGVSVQAFSTQVLADAASRTADPVVRGHASFAIYDHPDRYRLGAFEAAGKYAGWRHPELRLTVDTPDDLALIRAVFEALHPANAAFSTGDAIWLVADDCRLRGLNQHVPQRLVHQEKAQAHG